MLTRTTENPDDDNDDDDEALVVEVADDMDYEVNEDPLITSTVFTRFPVNAADDDVRTSTPPPISEVFLQSLENATAGGACNDPSPSSSNRPQPVPTPVSNAPLSRPCQHRVSCSHDEKYVYEPDTLDPSIHTDTFLMRWSLAINLCAGGFVCRDCGVGLPIGEVKTHFDNHHSEHFPEHGGFKELSRAILWKKYGDLVSEEVPEAWIPSILPATPQSYIKVIMGWTCIAPENAVPCYYSAETHSAMTKHIHHKNPSYKVKFVHLQNFYSHNRRKLFPITDPHQTNSADDLYLDIFLRKQKEMLESGCSDIILEKQLSTFLRDSRWMDVLENYDRHQIVSLISSTVLREDHVVEERIRGMVKMYLAGVNKNLGKGIHTEVETRIAVKMPEEE